MTLPVCLAVHLCLNPIDTKSDNIKQFFLNVNEHADSLLMSYYRYLDYKKSITPTKEYQKPVVIVSECTIMFLISGLICYQCYQHNVFSLHL